MASGAAYAWHPGRRESEAVGEGRDSLHAVRLRRGAPSVPVTWRDVIATAPRLTRRGASPPAGHSSPTRFSTRWRKTGACSGSATRRRPARRCCRWGGRGTSTGGGAFFKRRLASGRRTRPGAGGRAARQRRRRRDDDARCVRREGGAAAAPAARRVPLATGSSVVVACWSEKRQETACTAQSRGGGSAADGRGELGGNAATGQRVGGAAGRRAQQGRALLLGCFAGG